MFSQHFSIVQLFSLHALKITSVCPVNILVLWGLLYSLFSFQIGKLKILRHSSAAQFHCQHSYFLSKKEEEEIQYGGKPTSVRRRTHIVGSSSRQRINSGNVKCNYHNDHSKRTQTSFQLFLLVPYTPYTSLWRGQSKTTMCSISTRNTL